MKFKFNSFFTVDNKRVSPIRIHTKIIINTLTKKDWHLAEPGTFLVTGGLFDEKIKGKKHTALQSFESKSKYKLNRKTGAD
jgi:hypothetical protein